MSDGLCCRYRVRLLSDVVISASSATQGGHRTRDHIPGSVLLGAVAGQYGAFGEAAWQVFHAGAVRFGNAYPLTVGDLPTVPAPLAWHRPKVASPSGGGDAGELDGAPFNLAAPGDMSEQPLQMQQIRDTYFAADLSQVRPDVDYRQGTAIDRDRFGSARDGALFGYSKLRRGQAFWVQVAFDSSVSAAIRKQVDEILAGCTMSVGRSRHAEYGRIGITPLDAAVDAHVDQLLAATETMPAGAPVSVYLLSDLAPAEADEAPLPRSVDPRLFGLPAHWRFEVDHSFLRADRWAPFNGKRRLFDAERQVWQKGSVLTFVPEATEDVARDLDAARRATASGVGRFRAEGLGQVLIAPWFLNSPQPQPRVAAAVLREGARPASADSPPPPPDDALFAWARQRAADRVLPLLARRLAEACHGELEALYRSAKAEARREGASVFDRAPSRAQWGALAEQVTGLSDLESIVATLGLQSTPGQKDSEKGFCLAAARRKVWHESAMPTNSGRTFRAALIPLSEPDTLDAALREEGLPSTLRGQLCRNAILALARGMPRVMARLGLDDRGELADDPARESSA